MQNFGNFHFKPPKCDQNALKTMQMLKIGVFWWKTHFFGQNGGFGPFFGHFCVFLSRFLHVSQIDIFVKIGNFQECKPACSGCFFGSPRLFYVTLSLNKGFQIVFLKFYDPRGCPGGGLQHH